MKRSFGLWQLMGFAIVVFCGTILHFLYEWFGDAIWIAPFSGVNESTWEHMKLLFWPAFVFAIIQYLFFSTRESFWFIKLRGILLGIISIPIIYYTYNGVIGHSPDWINIAIFFVAAAIAFIYETASFNKKPLFVIGEEASLAILCIIAATFILFTFITPHLGIFEDPLTESYGINTTIIYLLG